MRGAEEEGASIVWHKVVCRRPPGTIALGRPSYSHMIAVSREPRQRPLRPGPDVLADAGFMSWSRAMGASACRVACRYLQDETDSRIVVDPFCGRGAVLAVANAMGFDAIGIDNLREALPRRPEGDTRYPPDRPTSRARWRYPPSAGPRP